MKVKATSVNPRKSKPWIVPGSSNGESNMCTKLCQTGTTMAVTSVYAQVMEVKTEGRSRNVSRTYAMHDIRFVRLPQPLKPKPCTMTARMLKP